METTIKNRQFEVSEIQLSYKTKVKPSQRPKISSSKDGYSILLDTWDDEKLEFVEQFKVLLLNRASQDTIQIEKSMAPNFPEDEDGGTENMDEIVNRAKNQKL